MGVAVALQATASPLPCFSTLAKRLSETDPESALEVLDTAITWEPYAESAYRQIISLHQHLGDTDAAHTTLRLLRTRLADLIDQIRTRYALGYHPAGTQASGRFHEIRLQLSPEIEKREGKLIVRTRHGYYR